MRRTLTLFLVLLAPDFAQAHQTIAIIQAYAFDTTPGMANAAAYVTLENTGPSEAKLTGISTNVAGFAQVHAHEQDGDLRRMVALDLPIILQPGEILTLDPGGIHIMLLDLKEPLVVGDQIDLTLHFEGRHVRDLDMSIEVFGLGSRDALVGKRGMTDWVHDDMNHSEHGP